MAYDEYLQERIERILSELKVQYEAKKMMGGLCYMMDDKMLCGLVKDQLMARIGPEGYEEALKMDHVNEMNFTGRAMKGYVFVDGPGVDMDEDLEDGSSGCHDQDRHNGVHPEDLKAVFPAVSGHRIRLRDVAHLAFDHAAKQPLIGKGHAHGEGHVCGGGFEQR